MIMLFKTRLTFGKISKQVLPLSFLCLGFAQALPLNDETLAKLPANSTIGVFSATFDPLTKGHLGIIEAALSSGNFSHILVIPTDPSVLKPDALKTEDRYALVEAAFKDHPQILYAQIDKLKSSNKTAEAINYLRDKKFSTMGVVLLPDLQGLIGPIKRIAISNRLPVDSWLVVAETEKDYQNFPLTYLFRNRKPLIHPIPESSSIVRKYFMEQRPDLSKVSDEDLPVLRSVAQFIIDHDLYLKDLKVKAPKNEQQSLREISTSADLKEVLAIKDKLVVVKFFAPWCPFCQAIKELYVQNAKDLKDKAHFVELDVDKFDDKPYLKTFNIEGIPTLLFFKNGVLVKRIEGLKSNQILEVLKTL